MYDSDANSNSESDYESNSESDYEDDNNVNNNVNNNFDNESNENESDGDDDGDGDGDENENENKNVKKSENIEADLLNQKKKDFLGYNNKINNNVYECSLCAKFFPTSMFLPNSSQCPHCWGWVCYNNLDLIQGIYYGLNSFDEVSKYLKYTYPLHPTTCTNSECVYNIIKKYAENNILQPNLSIELGLTIENNNNNNNLTINNSNKEYNIKKKKHNNFDYESSTIII